MADRPRQDCQFGVRNRRGERLLTGQWHGLIPRAEDDRDGTGISMSARLSGTKAGARVVDITNTARTLESR
jgi:hypothetical protein